MTVYQSLIAKVGKMPLDGTDDEVLKRLVLAVSSLPIETFDAMPQAAQLWFSQSADNLAAGLRVTPPQGFDRDAALHPPQPVRIARPNGSSYTPPPRSLTPPPPPPPGAVLMPRADDPVRDVICKMMIADPALSAEGLITRLAQHHIRVTTEAAATQRSFVMTVLRLVKEAGWRPPHVAA